MNPVLCEHANEVPNECRCEPACYCKTATCRGEKPYEFVTKEELTESLRRAEDAGTDSGDFCRTHDLAARLLKERDAFWSVAEAMDEHPGIGLSVYEAARRLLSQQPTPRGRGV